ncbi:hypothetical protein [Colidextribacter sp. OB.20]|uniref:hypothetical protein n=1 Tax=Colidextribacter sp. OB.20 TaxID=2304568 RepID=UPI001368C3D7|nr:hypothetical protein [Colidextribacter sp. OB.20]
MLFNKERAVLARAKKLPVVYDEDSPEMTDEMERAFTAVRQEKPYRHWPTAK